VKGLHKVMQESHSPNPHVIEAQLTIPCEHDIHISFPLTELDPTKQNDVLDYKSIHLFLLARCPQP